MSATSFKGRRSGLKPRPDLHFSPQWKLLDGLQDTADGYTRGLPWETDGTLTLVPATFLLAPLKTAPPTEVGIMDASSSPALNNLGNGPWFLSASSPSHINSTFPIPINKGQQRAGKTKNKKNIALPDSNLQNLLALITTLLSFTLPSCFIIHTLVTQQAEYVESTHLY